MSAFQKTGYRTNGVGLKSDAGLGKRSGKSRTDAHQLLLSVTVGYFHQSADV